MDPDSEADSQRALSLQWKSYKLLQDPTIRRVAQKIYRYDGIQFSVPVSGLSLFDCVFFLHIFTLLLHVLEIELIAS